MNIFALSKDPKEAAIYLADRHVVKMVLETAQILSTASHLNGKSVGYRPTHINHPCVKWAAATSDNFNWLVEHGVALSKEYTYRYDKIHKSEAVILKVSEEGSVSGKTGLTPFAQAMPDCYKQIDAVEAYREYYIAEKYHLFAWTKRGIPNWIM